VVRTSDFLLPDEYSSARSSRYPSISFSPTTGLWGPASEAVAETTSSAIDIWVRQVVVESPGSFASDKRQEVKSVVDSAIAKALVDVQCYAVEEESGASYLSEPVPPPSVPCWSVQNQPTSNSTARSLAFPSAADSQKFARQLSELQLSTSRVEMVKMANSHGTRRKFTSFFSKNGKDLLGLDEQSQDFGEAWWDDALFEMAARERNLEEMKSFKWMLFAARAFVMRFWGLAKVNIYIYRLLILFEC
jgi:hydroxymethylglutaryl-CoA reductase (NADPH)